MSGDKHVESLESAAQRLYEAEGNPIWLWGTEDAITRHYFLKLALVVSGSAHLASLATGETNEGVLPSSLH